MVQRKNIGLAIVLSIVTCGIYGIYWFITLTDDVNKLDQQEKCTSGGMAFLLSIVTCGIYMFYWLYKQGERIDRAANARGIDSSNSSILYIVLSVIGLSIVAYCLMQDKINKMADC
ncbi:MAG: DUF4234 domain-containing protein [Ruminococcus sp.]|nr:DUF4234 domain-containing protein [Ruminococcus sp.]